MRRTEFSAGHAPALPRALAMPLLLLTGACATGSSASFTMAPLFFTETADASGTILTEGATSATAARAEPAIMMAEAPRFILTGGNAMLPVAGPSVTPGRFAALPVSALLGANGGVTLVATASFGPVGLNATLSPGAVIVDPAAGIGAVASLDVAPPPVLTSVVAAAADGVGAAAAPVVGALPSVSGPGPTDVAAVAAPVAAVLPAVAVPGVAEVAAITAPVTAAVPSVAAPSLAEVAGAAPAVPAVMLAAVPAVAAPALPNVAVAAAPIAAPVMTATPLPAATLLMTQPVLAATAMAPSPAAASMMAGPGGNAMVRACLLGGC